MTDHARIDTHSHVVPPSYAAWLRRLGIDAGGLPIPHWDIGGALEAMETLQVATSILSVSTPGVHLGEDTPARDPVARAKAREVNEFAAEVVRTEPERFGFFATLTLPDVDGALEEAAYALDHLGADGVVLLANVHGRYLGDDAFDPLFDELNRRKSTVFVHPADLAAPPVPGLPAFVADFLLDTTRAAINLARSGTLARCPDLAIILSHGGGFLPYASYRAAAFASPPHPEGPPDLAGGLTNLRSFYFDVALSSSPAALPSLLAFADPTKVLYGSDFPYAPVSAGSAFAAMLDGYEVDDPLRRQIDRGNAEALFPRLARINAT